MKIDFFKILNTPINLSIKKEPFINFLHRTWIFILKGNVDTNKKFVSVLLFPFKIIRWLIKLWFILFITILIFEIISLSYWKFFGDKKFFKEYACKDSTKSCVYLGPKLNPKYFYQLYPDKTLDLDADNILFLIEPQLIYNRNTNSFSYIPQNNFNMIALRFPIKNKNGNILFFTNEKVLIYNFKNNSFSHKDFSLFENANDTHFVLDTDDKLLVDIDDVLYIINKNDFKWKKFAQFNSKNKIFYYYYSKVFNNGNMLIIRDGIGTPNIIEIHDKKSNSFHEIKNKDIIDKNILIREKDNGDIEFINQFSTYIFSAKDFNFHKADKETWDKNIIAMGKLNDILRERFKTEMPERKRLPYHFKITPISKNKYLISHITTSSSDFNGSKKTIIYDYENGSFREGPSFQFPVLANENTIAQIGENRLMSIGTTLFDYSSIIQLDLETNLLYTDNTDYKFPYKILKSCIIILEYTLPKCIKTCLISLFNDNYFKNTEKIRPLTEFFSNGNYELIAGRIYPKIRIVQIMEIR